MPWGTLLIYNKGSQQSTPLSEKEYKASTLVIKFIQVIAFQVIRSNISSNLSILRKFSDIYKDIPAKTLLIYDQIPI